MTRELEGLKEAPKAETTLKNQTEKRQAMMEYMGSSSRNSLPFTTDKH